MTTAGTGRSIRVPLSRSQRNIYNGVVQDGDPALYLIGRRYRFQPLGLPALLSALDATIRANPVHLCVLEPGGEDGYPVLAPRLRVDELIRVCTDDATDTAAQLKATWAPGLLGVPLVRYIVRTDDDGAVCGLDAYCHHLLLDGGGTAIIEGHLGGYLSGDAEFISSAEGLRSLEQAHRREAALIDDALQRLTAAATVELRADAENHRRADSRPPGHAARGVPTESVVIEGADYAALLAACQAQRVPLNVLVAAAATAVDAGERGGTDALLVHAIDNRFGEPDLDVASCLVNSVPQQVRFAPFASVGDLVRSMDRGYVKALRRRWLREERYRRMYLAINRATGVDALTLNYLPQPCAPSLRPFLAEPPLTTDIGPIEGRTVAAIADEAAHRLQIAIWDRADLPTGAALSGIAEQIATVLKSFAANWDRPVALTVGKWQVLTTGGTHSPRAPAPRLNTAAGRPGSPPDPTGSPAARICFPGWPGWKRTRSCPVRCWWSPTTAPTGPSTWCWPAISPAARTAPATPHGRPRSVRPGSPKPGSEYGSSTPGRSSWAPRSTSPLGYASALGWRSSPPTRTWASAPRT